MSNMSLGKTDLVDVDVEPKYWENGNENTFFIWYERRRYFADLRMTGVEVT